MTHVQSAGASALGLDPDVIRTAAILSVARGPLGEAEFVLRKQAAVRLLLAPPGDQLAAEVVARLCGDNPAAASNSPAHRSAAPAKPQMTKAAANAKAVELLKADPAFADRTAPEWARAIGCSVGLVAKLPLWRGVMERTGRGRGERARRPATVTLTPALEATVGDEDPELARLIAESGAGDRSNPSPLNSAPKTFRNYKSR